MGRRRLTASAAVAILFGQGIAHAQQAQPSAGASPAGVTRYVDSASPFHAPTASEVDQAGIILPDLSAAAKPGDAGNYDKYYRFFRAETDFATAYADITECDGYARGLSSGIPPSVGQGVLVDLLSNALSDAIYGSAARRKLRRSNMRTCMNFKGYSRHGVGETVWRTFNFEEGGSALAEQPRIVFLKQQALVASSIAPKDKALGL